MPATGALSLRTCSARCQKHCLATCVPLCVTLSESCSVRTQSEHQTSPKPASSNCARALSDEVCRRRSAAHRHAARQGTSKKLPPTQHSWLQLHLSFDQAGEFLRDHRVGDFVVRRSQSAPNTYAIAVVQERGGMRQIWHGLIDLTPHGALGC